jgi:hypothetical protein
LAHDHLNGNGHWDSAITGTCLQPAIAANQKGTQK